MNNTISITIIYLLIVGISLVFVASIFVIVVHFAWKIIREYIKSRKE